jgi:hypothetical protein
MKVTNFKERVAFAAMIAGIAALTAFRTKESDNIGPSPLLEGVNSNASSMQISYNKKNMIGRLTRIQQTADENYVDVRIPVYENGLLVSTLVSAHESGEDSEIFSSFQYAVNYRFIEKIRYYSGGQVQGYDSLVYNGDGRITARYFFSRKADGSFESHNYQRYTWNDAGNVTRLETYGRSGGGSNFALNAAIAYTYDNRPNPQRQVEGLCYITDIMPAFLSANNILSEEITALNSGSKQRNTFRYEYNAAQYPAAVTAVYGVDGASETTQMKYK